MLKNWSPMPILLSVFFKSGMGTKFFERPTLNLYKENHNKGFDCYP